MKSAWSVVVALAMALALPSVARADGDDKKPVDTKPTATDSARYEQLVEELKEQRALIEQQATELQGLRATISEKPKLSLEETEVPAEMTAQDKKAPPALPEDVKSKWGMNIYGFVEADFIHDNRQVAGLVDAAGNPAIPVPRTYQTTHGQTTFGARNSRLGLNISAPEWNGIRVSGKMEMDFLGVNGGTSNNAQTPNNNQEGNNTWVNPTFRMRHAYVVIDTDYITATLGQGWELFGWQPYFHPNTVDIQGVPGQIYSRSPKAQLSHKFKGPVDIELGVAASRPPSRIAEGPDLQAGVKISIPEWVGVHTIGATGTAIDAAAIGISGTTREWRIPGAAGTTNSDAVRGDGAALDLFLPILHPDKESRGNSLSVTGEIVYGKGINDLYTGFSGNLGNFVAASPVPDAGALGLENGDLTAVQWRTNIIGVQYYLPGDGTWWIAANYSSGKSNNIGKMAAANGTTFHAFQFINADLFWDLTPAVRLGLSVDQYKDYYPQPATGSGVNTGLDTRIQFSAFLLF